MEQQLFQHVNRPEWGLAMVASEQPTRRVYQFEDGQARVIAQAYWKLMKPVEDAEQLQRAVRRLRLLVKGTDVAMKSSPVASEGSLEEQLTILKDAWPEGFASETYQHRYRGGKSKLKSQIEPVLAMVEEQWNLDALPDPETPAKAKKVVDTLAHVLGKSDLLSATEKKALEALSGKAVTTVAEGFLAMLTAEIDRRFTLWLETLQDAGVTPSWGLVTAPVALSAPEQHVAVRPSVFKRQAKILMPTLKISSEATLESYDAMLGMSLRIFRDLKNAELSPKDLFDVRNFIFLTLRTDAARKLADL